MFAVTPENTGARITSQTSPTIFRCGVTLFPTSFDDIRCATFEECPETMKIIVLTESFEIVFVARNNMKIKLFLNVNPKL